MKLPKDLYSIKNPLVRKVGVAFFVTAIFPIFLSIWVFFTISGGLRGFLAGVLDALETLVANTATLTLTIKKTWKGQ